MIWSRYMRAAHAGLAIKSFPAPPAVTKAVVPDVRNQSFDDAKATLEAAGFTVKEKVVQSSLAPGIVAGDYFESPTPTPRSESLVRAAEVGLAEIGDLNREPREAIIACYAAMERELANVPGAAPQDFDTPTEVLVRAIERKALHADNATHLVNLFEEARFSPHVMNEGHRDVAVDALRLVLADLRSMA